MPFEASHEPFDHPVHPQADVDDDLFKAGTGAGDTASHDDKGIGVADGGHDKAIGADLHHDDGGFDKGHLDIGADHHDPLSSSLHDPLASSLADHDHAFDKGHDHDLDHKIDHVDHGHDHDDDLKHAGADHHDHGDDFHKHGLL
jgi:hypothetical protein